jgi:hypothetical protein
MFEVLRRLAQLAGGLMRAAGTTNQRIFQYAMKKILDQGRPGAHLKSGTRTSWAGGA